MTNANEPTTKTLLKEIDKIAYVASVGITVVLSVAYFVLWTWKPPDNYLLPTIREFALALITNFIPVFLIFVFSYALFRRIQSIKSEHESDELTAKIANRARAVLTDEIQNLGRKLGLSVEFVFDLPREEATGEIYRKAAEIADRANKEILVLWYHRPTPILHGDTTKRSESYKAERGRFYATIMRKCDEHKRDTFFYRRILQLVEPVQGGTVRGSALSSTMVEHCRQVLDFTRQYPEVAVIKHAPIFLEQTFMLVDERYVVWEIDAIDPETKQEFVDSLIVFDDLDKTFVRYLKNFFQKIDAHATKVKQMVD